MNIINDKLIDLNVNVNSQQDMFDYLADLAACQGRVTDSEAIKLGLQAREQESTTGFGKEVAIPHTKNKAVKEPTIIILRNKNNLEWHSLDGKPVNTVINLLVPDNQADIHLKMLARLSRQMMHNDFLEILKSGSKTDILAIITQVLSD